MQFHGIGREEHGAQAHQVTTCMHDHSHYKMEGDVSKAAASTARAAQSQQVSQEQGEGQLSLSAWLDNYLSKGKGLLKSIWGSSEISPVGEAGTKSGQEQVLAQISDSRETDGRGAAAAGQESLRTEEIPAVHAAKAAAASAAVEPPRTQESHASIVPQEAEGQEGNVWRKVKVRFKDIAGHLTGHLKGNFFNTQTKSSLSDGKAPVRETRKPVRIRKDAVEIASYHVEESHLLDSYDRKGGYSKLSTKK